MPEWEKKAWDVEGAWAVEVQVGEARDRALQGEIGFISSITQPFCGGCTRARVTADGIFYTCLFAGKGTNLMPLIRHSEHPADLKKKISDVWHKRDDRYSEERGLPGHNQEKVEMYRLGG